MKWLYRKLVEFKIYLDLIAYENELKNESKRD